MKISGFVGRVRPRNVFGSSGDGALLDALMREESADEKEEVGAVSLLEMVFLARAAPYK